MTRIPPRRLWPLALVLLVVGAGVVRWVVWDAHRFTIDGDVPQPVVELPIPRDWFGTEAAVHHVVAGEAFLARWRSEVAETSRLHRDEIRALSIAPTRQRPGPGNPRVSVAIPSVRPAPLWPFSANAAGVGPESDRESVVEMEILRTTLERLYPTFETEIEAARAELLSRRHEVRRLARDVHHASFGKLAFEIPAWRDVWSFRADGSLDPWREELDALDASHRILAAILPWAEDALAGAFLHSIRIEPVREPPETQPCIRAEHVTDRETFRRWLERPSSGAERLEDIRACIHELGLETGVALRFHATGIALRKVDRAGLEERCRTIAARLAETRVPVVHIGEIPTWPGERGMWIRANGETHTFGLGSRMLFDAALEKIIEEAAEGAVGTGPVADLRDAVRAIIRFDAAAGVDPTGLPPSDVLPHDRVVAVFATLLATAPAFRDTEVERVEVRSRDLIVQYCTSFGTAIARDFIPFDPLETLPERCASTLRAVAELRERDRASIAELHRRASAIEDRCFGGLVPITFPRDVDPTAVHAALDRLEEAFAGPPIDPWWEPWPFERIAVLAPMSKWQNPTGHARALPWSALLLEADLPAAEIRRLLERPPTPIPGIPRS